MPFFFVRCYGPPTLLFFRDVGCCVWLLFTVVVTLFVLLRLFCPHWVTLRFWFCCCLFRSFCLFLRSVVEHCCTFTLLRFVPLLRLLLNVCLLFPLRLPFTFDCPVYVIRCSGRCYVVPRCSLFVRCWICFVRWTLITRLICSFVVVYVWFCGLRLFGFVRLFYVVTFDSFCLFCSCLILRYVWLVVLHCCYVRSLL
jgi:hypothetical protein